MRPRIVALVVAPSVASRIVLVLATSLFTSLTLACQPDNIVLISVDTLRADHLGIYGYDRDTSPNIDRFFQDGEIFERAYSTHACTPPSVASLLSGLYPSSHGLRFFIQELGESIRLLPEYLKDHGYVSAAVVSNGVLKNRITGMGERFDSYDDRTSEEQPTRAHFFERRASRTADAAIEWLDANRGMQAPFLLWVHFMDPHTPYLTPAAEAVADFTHPEPRPVDLERLNEHARLPGVTDGLEYVDRYDEEIAYVDHHVGRILTRATDLGIRDDTVFVLTADHGETMLEHETYFSHCYHVWEPIMRIPLLIKRPGGPAKRVTWPVSAVDLTPSVIEYATGALDEKHVFDGVPFAERKPRDVIRLEAQYFPKRGSPHILGTVQGPEKWLVATEKSGGANEWFVDLGRDPSELGRGPWRQGEGADVLRAWNAAEGSYESRARGRKLPPTEVETERALRALGYAE